ncbi:MAG: hypothetical protein BBJ60_12080 [Desulfobacterales bacterium S7086C20]|nr:MAG: hypothetical protein BBJ60_12080 [Desulfobacterales bacterium S7086C20]
MARIVTVTSGKGGVGKTNISVSLALHLASLGHRTCLFDADLGLANVNIILGLYPEHTLEDVILNGKTLSDIVIRKYNGMDIIPGSSGIEKIAHLEFDRLKPLFEQFSGFDSYDFFIFDTSAGVSGNVISFCKASSEVVLIVTPEPTSLTDGYGLLKILSLNGFKGPAMVVVNESKDAKTANIAFTKLKNTVHKHLPIKIVPLGLVLHDDYVAEAVKEQKPFISRYPHSDASKCIRTIAKRLVKKEIEVGEEYTFESFWANFVNYYKVPLRLPSSRNGNGSTASEYGIKKQREEETAQAAGNRTGSTLAADPGGGEPARFADIRRIARMVTDNNVLLTKLSETVSSLAKDIRSIRQVVGKGNRLDSHRGMSSENVVSSKVATVAAVTAKEPRTVSNKKKQATRKPEYRKPGNRSQAPAQQLPTNVPSTNVAKQPATKLRSSWVNSSQWEEDKQYVSQRKHERVELVCPVTLEGIHGTAKARDISLGGLFLEIDSSTDHQFKVGQRLSMTMRLPTENQNIVVEAEVTMVRDQGIGCKFLAMELQPKKAIRRCISLLKETLPIKIESGFLPQQDVVF